MNIRDLLIKFPMGMDDIVEIKATIDFVIGLDNLAIKDNYLFFMRSGDEKFAEDYVMSALELDSVDQFDEWLENNVP